MAATDPTGTDWSAQEVDLIVADYFNMLGKEIAQQHYVKSHHNNALQELTGRSHRSIEFKHQNISAVLLKLGMPWIAGYKPKMHYQRALLDGIDRYLAATTEPMSIIAAPSQIVTDAGALYVGPAPSIEPSATSDPPPLQRLMRKFDPAARDERNRTLGKLGEERVFESERTRLRSLGLDDLAKKVRWVSQEDGDGAGYDIRSFSTTGEERLLEVKTTVGYALTPFFLSSNEKALSVERPDNFRIFRLYDFAKEPKAFKIAPPLESALMLEPANYRASFR